MKFFYQIFASYDWYRTVVSTYGDCRRFAQIFMEKEINETVPTKAELEALKVLWQHGPSTVRFVHDEIAKGSKTVRYTTTLKMMQLMAEKRMVGRNESKMTHIYTALLEEKKQWEP